MLGEKYPDPGPGGTGEKDHQEKHTGAEEENRLQYIAPVAADDPDVITGSGHEHEIDAGTQQHDGVECHAVGDDHGPGLSRAPPGGYPEQRHQHGVDRAPGSPDVRGIGREQHGFGVQVEIEGEHAAQGQAQELQAPAVLGNGIAVELLHQHHAGHRQQGGEEGITQVLGDPFRREQRHGLGNERPGGQAQQDAPQAIGALAGAAQGFDAAPEKPEPGQIPEQFHQGHEFPANGNRAARGLQGGPQGGDGSRHIQPERAALATAEMPADGQQGEGDGAQAVARRGGQHPSGLPCPARPPGWSGAGS